MDPLLFDRFESDATPTPESLARDIADILGGRRIFNFRAPGVLGWGLPPMTGMSPNSERDRQRTADLIADQIRRFEPRLVDIKVIPAPESLEFAFQLEARLLESEDESITIRILSPRRGGGLGAEVAVMTGREAQDLDD